MSITNEQYERIVRFLDGEMELEEMEAFEDELNSHPEMRAQLDFEQSVRDSFAWQHVSTVTDIEMVEAARGRTQNIPRMLKWVAAGAAVITALVLTAVFWQKPVGKQEQTVVTTTDQVEKKPVNPEPEAKPDAPTPDVINTSVDLLSLFKQYFKKDSLPDEYPIFLAEAFTDYESGHYKTLQQLDLKNIPETRSGNTKENILALGHYYKGLAFLQTGNSKNAIINLDWVVNQPDQALQTKAEWYLALAYLQENNKEKAIELCRRIVSRKTDPMAKNAKKLLNSLQN